MYAIYGLPFTIKKYPSHVSINLPYMNPTGKWKYPTMDDLEGKTRSKWLVWVLKQFHKPSPSHHYKLGGTNHSQSWVVYDIVLPMRKTGANSLDFANHRETPETTTRTSSSLQGIRYLEDIAGLMLWVRFSENSSIPGPFPKPAENEQDVREIPTDLIRWKGQYQTAQHLLIQRLRLKPWSFQTQKIPWLWLGRPIRGVQRWKFKVQFKPETETRDEATDMSDRRVWPDILQVCPFWSSALNDFLDS